MSAISFSKTKLIVAGSAVFVALALPMLHDGSFNSPISLISGAYAAEQGQGKGGSDAQRGKGGAGEKAGGGAQKEGRGNAIDKRVFRTSSEEEDSDRPIWAGVKGGKAGGGGKPAGAGTKKGDLFGDMVILLRDVNGEPILVDGLEQVAAYIYEGTQLVPLLVDGKPVAIPYDAEGELVSSMTIGEVTYDVYAAEVDLGRLSVSRSPSKVLDHALDEALAKLTSGVVTLDSTGRLAVDGVTIDSPLENLALYDKYMTTGTLPGVTIPEGFDPASLFAAAADKTGTIGVDTVVYLNSIRGINTPGSYYDFSSYEYDRADTWSNVVTTVLVLQPDGSYVPTVVSVYDAVFDNTAWDDPTTIGGADDFATAADDYLQVIEFVHDNAVR